MSMYNSNVYTCCLHSVTCNWMSCATCCMQLHKFAVACVACNWNLVAKYKKFSNEHLQVRSPKILEIETLAILEDYNFLVVFSMVHNILYHFFIIHAQLNNLAPPKITDYVALLKKLKHDFVICTPTTLG
jgi:hypothetical protein